VSGALFYGYGWAARNLWQPALQAAGFDRFGAVDGFVPLEVLARTGVSQVHMDVTEISRGDYDVAVVASPNRTHADVAVALLDCGIPTVVEKPVCLLRSDVARLRAAADRSGAALLRSRSPHYDPSVSAFLKHLRGVLPGNPERVSAIWTRAQGLPRSRWLTLAAHAGAGSSVDLGSHLLECILDVTNWRPLTLTSARFTDANALRVGDDDGYANWHGLKINDPGPTEPVDVDVAADLRFDQDGKEVVLRTAWLSSDPGDLVSLEVAAGEVHTRLDTLLGMSPAAKAPPSIETNRGGRRTSWQLPARPPAAHARMVADFVARGFDPERLGQTWEQLEVLAGATESIIASHTSWRAGGGRL
jgi:oxidoreductase